MNITTDKILQVMPKEKLSLADYVERRIIYAAMLGSTKVHIPRVDYGWRYLGKPEEVVEELKQLGFETKYDGLYSAIYVDWKHLLEKEEDSGS